MPKWLRDFWNWMDADLKESFKEDDSTSHLVMIDAEDKARETLREDKMETEYKPQHETAIDLINAVKSETEKAGAGNDVGLAIKTTSEEPMNILELKRSYLDNGTFGKLSHRGIPIMHTVERPWLSNQRSISCIPAGVYKLKRYTSTNYPSAFYLENTDLGVSLRGKTQRTAILIHVANFVKDVEGCIGPGMELHPTTWGVSQSRVAMGELNKLIKEGEEWELVIT